MERSRWLACVVLLALLASGPARAEEAPPAPEPPGGMPAADRLDATLASWLAHGDDRRAAWAGWLVADRRRTVLREAVAARLEQGIEAPRGEHAYFVEAALLDALVRTDGTVSGRVLEALAGTHPEAVAVLLCRRRRFDPAHLAVFRALGDGLDYEAYAALGNRLAAWRAPGFAATILGALELERRVRIWDEDPPYPPYRPAGDGVPGDWRLKIPTGFPPHGRYSLSFEAYTWAAWTALARGRRTVYVRRLVHDDGWTGGGCVASSPDPQRTYREEWLTGLLAGTDVPALPAFATLDVKWTGGRQPWRRRTTQAIQGVHEAFRAVRDALHARGLLTDAERRAVHPRLALEFVDRRRLKRRALPPVPEVPFEPGVPPLRRPRRPGGL